MWAAHWGLAFACSHWKPSIPLLWYLLASLLQDILMFAFDLCSVERGRYNLDKRGAWQMDWFIPYSHSLISTIIQALGFAAFYAWYRQRSTSRSITRSLTTSSSSIPWSGVGIMMALIFSHWILDIVVKRTNKDGIPVWLDNTPRLGFALWDHLIWYLIVETALTAPFVYMWWHSRATTTTSLLNSPTGFSFPHIVILLILNQYMFTFSPRHIYPYVSPLVFDLIWISMTTFTLYVCHAVDRATAPLLKK